MQDLQSDTSHIEEDTKLGQQISKKDPQESLARYDK